MALAIPLKPNNFALRREAGTLLVQINRAEKKNALTLAMWSELARQFRSIATDRDVRAALAGADHREAVAAFAARRKPVFIGS